jgi:uncharacterized protein (TIGR03382 family)
MTLRTLVIGVALFAAPAFADDGGLLDGGETETPDASAGNGGADHMTQEGDEDMMNGTCALSRDCERGFACVNGMCRYTGYRQATQGCNAAPSLALLSAAAALWAVRRRRSR